jgi:hypothetical protein
MPLFGGNKEEIEQQNAELRAEVQRLSALSLQDLAVEVMTKGFGPGGPGADGADVMASRIAGEFAPAVGHGIDQGELQDLFVLSPEGLQVLEHACLVRSHLGIDAGTNSNYNIFWTATRLGQAALAQNGVQRVLAGGSL